jgi:hypothetical protein
MQTHIGLSQKIQPMILTFFQTQPAIVPAPQGIIHDSWLVIHSHQTIDHLLLYTHEWFVHVLPIGQTRSVLNRLVVFNFEWEFISVHEDIFEKNNYSRG